MNRLFYILLVLLVSVFARAERLSLDGAWDFKLLDNSGKTFQQGKIVVPAPWEAMGYGAESKKLKYQHIGVGSYERDFIIPESWQGKDIFLTLGGISRYAKIYIDGKSVGEEAIGLVGTHTRKVNDFVKFGKKARLRIDVDSRQRIETDAMLGAAQLNDYMEAAWGGLWGHVYLEALPTTRIDDLYVYSKISPSRVFASARVIGDIPDGAKFVLEVFNLNGKRVAKNEARIHSHKEKTEISCVVDDAKLWSPDSPNLYKVKLSLCDGKDVLHFLENRMGIREIKIVGNKIFLNGKRLYLFGYGDDHIYVNHVAMPSDKNMYIERLKKIKRMGFNHVRHHSTIMPPEYYEACDEIGMLPNAEFTIGYPLQMPLTKAWAKTTKGKGDVEATLNLYRERFEQVVRDNRNFTCIFSWIGGNEIHMGNDFFPRDNSLMTDFYKIAKTLDSQRIFSDTDGEWDYYILNPKNDKYIQEINYALFDEWKDALTLKDKFNTRKHANGKAPLRPVISHETGNYTTFSRPSQYPLFKGTKFHGFWLVDAYKNLEKRGMLAEAEKWATSSEKLFVLLHKYNMEAIRKNNDISGYHWWLIQDYWTSSDGIFDIHFRLKDGISESDIANINSPLALLQDGLKNVYSSGESLSLKGLVSNYTGESFSGNIAVEVKLGGNIIYSKTLPSGYVAHGDLREAFFISLKELPQVDSPKKLEISLKSEDGKWSNSWGAWLFPSDIKPSENVKIFADANVAKILPSSWGAEIFSADKIQANGIYFVSEIDEVALNLLENGARVVALGAGKITPPIEGKFKSQWWRAGASDRVNNTGTYVDVENPIVGEFMPEAWCDNACLDILNGSSRYNVGSMNVDNIVRSLSSMMNLKDYSYLFGAKVDRGVLIVSGFNHAGAKNSPASQWLLKRMADANWSPSKTLKIADLKKAMADLKKESQKKTK